MNPGLKISFIAVFAVLICLCFVIVSGCTDSATPEFTDEQKAIESLQYLTSGVNKSLSDTLVLIEDTSVQLANTDRNLTSVNPILAGSQESPPWIDSVAFINTEGVVVAIMPESYSGLVGADLSYQEIVREGLTDRSPLISDYMLLEEGEMGVVLESPVFSGEGEFAGIVSMVIDPAAMIGPYADNINSEYGYSVMAAQPDGVILYDEDLGEIGNETFGNPLYEAYPDLMKFAEAYSTEPSGSYVYKFRATGSDEDVVKHAFWNTAEILGSDWRLFVIIEA